ncbi:integral membrane protein [Fusarium napiforme]|uniref:Integral membrane protein n=1 Tax=Fusarium napiforme TaxID=42672 RepID=A0A8H5IGI6_9HYPO|nr:integral membrane protein [Fusarium napiforme]
MHAGPSGVVVLTVIYVLTAVATTIIGARIYLRLVIQKQRLVAADWLRISAWCSAFLSGFFDILFEKEGVLKPGLNYTLSNWDAPVEQQIRVRKYTWANAFPFYTTFYLCKASLLVIYLQLFPPFMVMRRFMVWIVVVYCICAYIVTMSLQLFLCYPIQRNWAVTKPEEECSFASTLLMFQINWALHFVGSIALFCLPFLIIHNLNMRTKVKVSVYCIFLLGIIDIAFSLTRFLTVQLGNSEDFIPFTIIGKYIGRYYCKEYANLLPELWCSLDLFIGLVICCIPALRPYLNKKGVNYNIGESGRPSKSGHAIRRTGQSGFEEIIEGSVLRGDGRDDSWSVSHSCEITAELSDKKENGSDIELVSIEVSKSSV